MIVFLEVLKCSGRCHFPHTSECVHMLTLVTPSIFFGFWVFVSWKEECSGTSPEHKAKVWGHIHVLVFVLHYY